MFAFAIAVNGAPRGEFETIHSDGDSIDGQPFQRPSPLASGLDISTTR